MAATRVTAFLFAALDARTIRPGWQLPTYDGTKSYQNLLVEVYGMMEVYNFKGDFDTAIQIRPVSFIRSGFYYYASGGFSARNNNGDYWQARDYSIIYARVSDFSASLLQSQDVYDKGYGFSLRCPVR